MFNFMIRFVMTLNHTYYRILVLMNKAMRQKFQVSLYRTLLALNWRHDYSGSKNSSQVKSTLTEVRTQCRRHINTHVDSSVMVHQATDYLIAIFTATLPLFKRSYVILPRAIRNFRYFHACDINQWTVTRRNHNVWCLVLSEQDSI
jgi:hypothetical protein